MPEELDQASCQEDDLPGGGGRRGKKGKGGSSDAWSVAEAKLAERPSPESRADVTRRTNAEARGSHSQALP